VLIATRTVLRNPFLWQP